MDQLGLTGVDYDDTVEQHGLIWLDCHKDHEWQTHDPSTEERSCSCGSHYVPEGRPDAEAPRK